LLNQNINAKDFKYSCDEDTTQLLGCKYTLLRREFLKYKSWNRKIPVIANKILVTMGGSDAHNVTLKVINAMNLLGDSNLNVKIVIGPENPNLATIKKALHQATFSIQLIQRADMPKLMRWADISISAGGSTCWEMAFMGLPSLIITVADNQVGIAKGLANIGVGVDLGWFDELSENILSKYIEQIIENSITRKEYLEKGIKLLDGLGVDRVIDAMRKH
jgi:spore coat polysaccharide biosynthesis predicted glycosyltransferase SpsG